MTDIERIEMVKAMSDEKDTEVISAYLYMTGKQVIALCCPKETSVPDRWEALLIDATVYKLNKRGAEGEITHDENGINRRYESGDIPASMLRAYGVVGTCEVIS